MIHVQQREKVGYFFEPDSTEFGAPKFTKGQVDRVQWLDFEYISKPVIEQPRSMFDEIQELAANIDEHGLLLPIVVLPHPSDKTLAVLDDGDRRSRAMKLLKWPAAPALVLATKLSPAQTFLRQAIGSVQKKGLLPIEEAYTFGRWIDLERKGGNQNCDLKQCARQFNVTEDTVRLRLNFLTLPRQVQDYMKYSLINVGQARELLSYMAGRERRNQSVAACMAAVTAQAEEWAHGTRKEPPVKEVDEPQPEPEIVSPPSSGGGSRSSSTSPRSKRVFQTQDNKYSVVLSCAGKEKIPDETAIEVFEELVEHLDK